MSDISLAAIAPLLILALVFVFYCWGDIARNDVRHLPKWLWAVIVFVSIPFGGIIYLIVGRDAAPRQ